MAGPERADAARNRAAILAAATELFDRDGVEQVSMNDIARAAGVGKGTIFRRFGDRTALIEAVLLPRAAAMRRLVDHGPAPLGPGGEPEEALHAYLDTLLDFVWANRALIRALEHRVPHSYYAHSTSQYWLTELTHRLATTHSGEDIDYLTYMVSTALRADVVDYLVSVRGMDLDRIRAGLRRLVISCRCGPAVRIVRADRPGEPLDVR